MGYLSCSEPEVRWRMFRSLLPLLLLLGLVAQATAADKPRRASPVMVAEAVQQTLAPLSWYSGTVISRHDARLAAEVEGLNARREALDAVKKNAGYQILQCDCGAKIKVPKNYPKKNKIRCLACG